MAKINRIIEEIRKALEEAPRGLIIQEISQKTKVSRITASIALAKLEGAGEIDIRVIGNCKLHYLKRGKK